jgi:hypothetical protein
VNIYYRHACIQKVVVIGVMLLFAALLAFGQNPDNVAAIHAPGTGKTTLSNNLSGNESCLVINESVRYRAKAATNFTRRRETLARSFAPQLVLWIVDHLIDSIDRHFESRRQITRAMSAQL